MVDVAVLLRSVLVLLRLVVFALTLGITIISFQAYTQRPSERLQYAFLGFAFISMGVAITSVITQIGVAIGDPSPAVRTFFQMAETVPFIIGFSMLSLSLYQ